MYRETEISIPKEFLIGLLTCFQVSLIDIRRAIASAQCLLDLISILHHVLQLILNVLNVKKIMFLSQV